VQKGMLAVPVEAKWVIQRWAADLTSRSLREADPTGESLRGEIRSWANMASRSFRTSSRSHLVL